MFTTTLNARTVGRCVFLLLRGLKKQPRLPSSEKTFIQQTWEPRSYGTLVVILECGSNSSAVMGEPGGSKAGWQAVPANRFRQPMENHFLVKSASHSSTNGKN